MNAVIIWIHCYNCGDQFSCKEREYTKGKVCGQC